jgi:hypothetical protein
VNERIKELGVQSKILQHINGMKRYNNQDKIEKFAELIVRECIDTYDYWSTHSMDKTSFVVAKTHVKKHFGVKE